MAEVAAPVHLIASLNFLIGSRLGGKEFSTEEILDMLDSLVQAEALRSAHLGSSYPSLGTRNQNQHAS